MAQPRAQRPVQTAQRGRPRPQRTARRRDQRLPVGDELDCRMPVAFTHAVPLSSVSSAFGQQQKPQLSRHFRASTACVARASERKTEASSSTASAPSHLVPSLRPPESRRPRHRTWGLQLDGLVSPTRRSGGESAAATPGDAGRCYRPRLPHSSRAGPRGRAGAVPSWASARRAWAQTQYLRVPTMYTPTHHVPLPVRDPVTPR